MAKVSGADALKRAVVNYERRCVTAFRRVLEDEARVVEQRGKTEHVWQNRTGRAEAGLTCLALQAENGRRFTLQFSHGRAVPYGVFLELAHQGRFAVLWPTLRSEWPRVLSRCAAAIREVRPA